jgi:hypothetical protein
LRTSRSPNHPWFDEPPFADRVTVNVRGLPDDGDPDLGRDGFLVTDTALGNRSGCLSKWRRSAVADEGGGEGEEGGDGLFAADRRHQPGRRVDEYLHVRQVRSFLVCASLLDR